MHSSNSEKLQHSEFEYHVRIYRDEDRQQVHELFENAMFWQPHSPVRPFLKIIAKSSIQKALYFASAIGILLWPSYPRLGPAILLTAVAISLSQFILIVQLILKMTKKNLSDDLADVRGHYELIPSPETLGHGHEDLLPSGPKAFWVVEATHKVTGRTELAGCCGIDVRNEAKMDGELRRMVVSGRHLRRGVAAMIVRTAIAYAKSHKLSSIYLSTSMAQEAAIQLYKKFGWVEEKRRDIAVFGFTAQIVHMRLHLAEKFRSELESL
ncbi:hypothetical protein P691DRAFT_776329 [Macrolepiota fuliginosa MF-IS2]|uniref:N-acetyltransferase domain-containing protein n=1 Tax=Macrolepiota fuliginosa MF-IS2 TaxID=1400762 RepID=A0A9P6C3D0_9AGAR|nr:hypothetical protein P691DRAFT_776329 [Macrolepiota fuliginosa MF-IS2]